MKLEAIEILGAHLVLPDQHGDLRGAFIRTYCRDEFKREGLECPDAQVSVSTNIRAGTLRGLHYQVEPHDEAKLIRCTRGRVFDVLVDIRPSSATYKRVVQLELDAEGYSAIYAPRGVAHGFMTLMDDTELLYMISSPYAADAVRGIRYDDPGLAISWPMAPVVISDRDLQHPDHRW